MRRHAIEIAQLIDAHAQREQHFEIEFANAAAGIMLDQEIELCLVTEHAENDLGGETGIAGIERRGAGEQQIGRIAAAADFAESVEG